MWRKQSLVAVTQNDMDLYRLRQIYVELVAAKLPILPTKY